MGNNIQAIFLPVLVFVGMFSGSSGAYMTLKMYSKLNLLIYMLGPAITLLGFGLSLMLTFLANFPYKNSKIFKLCWNQFGISKMQRKMLHACKPVSFKIGPYGMVTSKLGLIFCDDIIRNTVTMMLLN
jgi:hypothetical protein